LFGGGTVALLPLAWRGIFTGAVSIVVLICALIGYRAEKKAGGLTATNRDCFVTGLVTGGLGIAALIAAWFLQSKDFFR
ncbi:MAG: hypothetical protein AAB215_02940, partial [Planctomycetota bacterium]